MAEEASECGGVERNNDVVGHVLVLESRDRECHKLREREEVLGKGECGTGVQRGSAQRSSGGHQAPEQNQQL